MPRLNYKNNIRIGKLVMYGDVGYEIFKKNRSQFDWSRWKGYKIKTKKLNILINYINN